VIAALHKAGKSLRQIALSHGYSADTLGAALTRSYPKAEALIAAALNLPVSTIWPARERVRQARRSRKILKEPARDQVGA
jgi:Ner family transcriptional regulator